MHENTHYWGFIMLHQALNQSVGGPTVPLIVMPASEGNPQPMFERMVTAVETELAFPVLLMAPDMSEPHSIEGWPTLFAELQRKYDLTDRGLVLGCGAGARLAQYFTLENPSQVMACVVLSADAWASVDDCPKPAAAKSVRWLIGCGTQEPAYLMQQAEYFQVELVEAGCAVDFMDWDTNSDHLPEYVLQNALRFFNDLGREDRQAA